jgi:hypothetical protein
VFDTGVDGGSGVGCVAADDVTDDLVVV